MYTTLLFLHSWLRWVVLILAVLLVLVGLVRWSRADADTKLVDKLSGMFVGTLDLQFLIGLILYFIAPTVRTLFADFGAGMGDRVIRFWGVEHIFGMLVAVVLSHIGRVKIKRAPDAVGKHRAAAIWIGIALLIMLLTIPWPGMPQGRPLFRI